MSQSWIGPARYLFIPLIVENTAGFFPPPADYRDLVRSRVYFDPDPLTNEDRSLTSYINSISNGRALLSAAVAKPVTLSHITGDDNATLLAINAHPTAHLYEYLAVVYPSNMVGAGSGMAQGGKIDFDPPRTPNRTKARCRFLHDAPIGVWAMEVLHNVTKIGDYYNGFLRLHRFEEMDASAATHPCAYTKLEAGWLDAEKVPEHVGSAQRYVLHAIGLTHPAPPGRVAGVRVRTSESGRYLFVEARLESDRWDRGFSGSQGIPSSGVIVYEFAPQSDAWPRPNPGPWPPLQLRTPVALTVNQSFTHQDAEVEATVTVISETPAGFVVEIASAGFVYVPYVVELPANVAGQEILAAGLIPEFVGQQGPQAVVVEQDPEGGTQVKIGTKVTLMIRDVVIL